MSSKALGPRVRYRQRAEDLPEGRVFVLFDTGTHHQPAFRPVPGSERVTATESVRLSVRLARLWPHGIPPGANAWEL